MAEFIMPVKFLCKILPKSKYNEESVMHIALYILLCLQGTAYEREVCFRML